MEKVTNSQISEDEIKDILIQSIRKTGNCFNLLQKIKNQSVYEIYETLIDYRQMKLSNVPKKYRTLECCKTALKYSIASLRDVPEKLKTGQFYEYFIKNGGNSDRRLYTHDLLKMIPFEFKTYDICKTALQRRVGRLQNVPFEHRDLELCKIAIKKDLCSFYKNKITDIIPLNSIDEESIIILLKRNPRLYYDPIVQENYNTQAVFNQYLKCTFEDIRKIDIPIQFRNNQTYYSLFLNISRPTGDHLPQIEECIPEEFKTEQLYVKHLNGFPEDILRIPRQKITYQMVKTALTRSPQIMKKLYNNKNSNSSTILKFINEQVCYLMFPGMYPRGCATLQYIPSEYRSTRVCIQAIENNISQIEYVPEKLKTKQIYDTLLSQINEHTTIIKAKKILSYIPEQFKTKETFIDIIKSNPKLLSIVPKKFKAPQLYKVAAEMDVKYLSKIL